MLRVNPALILFTCVALLSSVQDGWSQETPPRGLVIRGLRFVGNSAIDDLTLSRSIVTSNSSFFARSPLVRWLGFGEKRFFDETEFRRDVIRLALLYRQSGYVNARVDTVVARSQENVVIRVLINEGDPVNVVSLTITGTDGVVAHDDLLNHIPLRADDAFDRFAMRASADSIKRYLQNRGYPFAQVFTNFDMAVLEHTATIRFDVRTGPRAVFGEVLVEGANVISEHDVRRGLSFKPGDQFSREDLLASQRSLYRLNVYRFVDISLRDPAVVDSTVPIRVRVSEGRFRRVRIGVGYGTVDCFRAGGSLGFNNFFGGARSFEITARLSKIGTGSPFEGGLQNNICPGLSGERSEERLELNYNVSASVRFPFLFTRGTAARLTISGERRSEIRAFLRRAVGAELAITHRATPNLPITLSYEISYGKTEADQAIFCEFFQLCTETDTRPFTEELVRSTVGLSFVYDRSNSPLNPNRGAALSAEVRHASSLTGSDPLVRFSKGVLEFVSYHSISRHGVFAWRLRAGTIVSPGVSLAGQELSFIPPEERFYAGGPNSVRGFAQNELGQIVRVVDSAGVDTTTSPTGGNTMILANAELRFPLPGIAHGLMGGVFVDVGQVWVRGSELFRSREMKVTPGIGLRLSTPIGPVRLDAAYNPHDPDPGPLYREVGTDLVLDPEDFQPLPPGGFLNRVALNFAVGHAF